jgi:hypothetical protein
VQFLAFLIHNFEKFTSVLEPHAPEDFLDSVWWRVGRGQGASVVLRYCSAFGLSWCFTVRNFEVYSARLSEVAIF